MQALTARQREVFSYIVGYWQDEQVSPTIRDICRYFGFSINGVVCHLNALEAKGAFVDAAGFQQIDADKGLIGEVRTLAKQNAMATVAILPIIMACCYVGLILYFRSKGGYEAIELDTEGAAEPQEAVTE